MYFFLTFFYKHITYQHMFKIKRDLSQQDFLSLGGVDRVSET